MKFSALFLITILFSSLSAQAAGSDLFVKDGEELISVSSLIADEVDVNTAYGFDKFCYAGTPQTVIQKMKKWSASTEFFFSGGGGGFVLKKIDLLRGFVTYDLKMTLEDEVVPGEFKTVLIKPCSLKK